jgi:cysteine desulfurase
LIKLVESMDRVQLVSPRAVTSKNGAHGVTHPTRLANTVSFVVEGSDSIALLAGLDLEGICASSGSACSAGSLEPSHVITALGVKKALANSLVRFSIGRETTEEEISFVERTIPAVIKRAQRFQ